MSEPLQASGIRIDYGGVAQLGERELCKLEAVGSIPSTSTKDCFSWMLTGSWHEAIHDSHPDNIRLSRKRLLFDN